MAQAVLQVGICILELCVVLGRAVVSFDGTADPYRRQISADSLIPLGVLTV